MKMTEDKYQEVNDLYSYLAHSKRKKGFWDYLFLSYKEAIEKHINNNVSLTVIILLISQDFKKNTNTELSIKLNTFQSFRKRHLSPSEERKDGKPKAEQTPKGKRNITSFAPSSNSKKQSGKYKKITSLEDFRSINFELKFETEIEILKPYIYFLVKNYVLNREYVPGDIQFQLKDINKLLLKRYFLAPMYSDVKNDSTSRRFERLKTLVDNMKDEQDLDWINLQ